MKAELKQYGYAWEVTIPKSGLAPLLLLESIAYRECFPSICQDIEAGTIQAYFSEESDAIATVQYINNNL